ncbi:MAG: hypothetical protein KKF41_13995 [Actinobacteria bacterium]|nr:hypothetical protein [Actinomycetota bacterium]MBU1944196.1 hypothetical protein [Actinomycetota bacterium]MBU2688685.1 hypothetical protein [Actinomycetota bacterium]
MKIRRLAKLAVLALLVSYAYELASLRPTPHDLLDPRWHVEAQTRIALKRLAWLLPRLYARYGERGVKALQHVFYQVGRDRAELMRRELEIDVNDARSLGRVLDYEDGLVGVRGVWTEECRGRAVKEERYCPGAAELARCPEVCTKLMMAMEAGTFSIIQPGLAVPRITKLLSRGDDCCLAVIELPVATEPGDLSPQATPGQFPPVLKVPGLRAKLMLTGFTSVLKAVATLLREGPEQPMEWYEHFRYAPGDAAG